ARLVDQLERFIERPRDLIAVTAVQSLLDPRRIDFDAEENRAVHRRSQRLCATHAAEAAGQNEFSIERTAEMFTARRCKSFKRSLHNPLAADVNPRTGSHLPVHCQPHSFEAIKLDVIIPLSDQVRIGNEDARRFLVCPKFPHRLARLHEKRLVVFEAAQRTNNRVERFPASGSAPSPAVNYKLVWIFCYIRIEIVHQHPHGCLLVPAFAGTLAAVRRMDDSSSTHSFLSSPSKAPRRIASATWVISPDRGRSCTSGGAIFRTAANARSTPTPAFKGRRCSKPSAAASNSMASKLSARSTIARS